VCDADVPRTDRQLSNILKMCCHEEENELKSRVFIIAHFSGCLVNTPAEVFELYIIPISRLLTPYFE